MLAELKQCFMEAYDDNQDGKIDIREVKFFDSIGQIIHKQTQGKRGFCLFISIQPLSTSLDLSHYNCIITLMLHSKFALAILYKQMFLNI